ncbi:MAG: P-type conjugative transfer protein TrbG [Succinivibrio sp.]
MRLAAGLIFSVVLWGSVQADEFYNAYSETDDVSYLDEQDLRTLGKLKTLESTKLKGEALSAGKVVFTYGSGIPTVVCAILELTDISMQEGERILSVQLGDAVRWNVESAVSGEGSTRVEHLIVKALDSALKTSMLVTTDRRTYHFRLKSTAHDFMPAVSFYYPNSKLKKSRSHTDYAARQTPMYTYNASSDDATGTSDLTVRYSSDTSMADASSPRSYNYSYDGDERILPVNVFDDGQRTYIQMSKSIRSNELPALLEVTDSGGFIFGEERLSAVNFSVSDNTYVIDGLYTHLRLCANHSGSGISADIMRLG